MIAALEGWVVSSTPRPHFAPGKDPVSILAGPQGRSGRAENLVTTGIRSRTVQPLVSRYTDWATRPTFFLSVAISTENIMYFTFKSCWFSLSQVYHLKDLILGTVLRCYCFLDPLRFLFLFMHRAVCVPEILWSDIRSSWMLRSVDLYFVTEFSDQPMGLIFKGQAVRICKLSRNVGK